MKQLVDGKLKRIMDGMRCPKDFICKKSKFKNLCEANYYEKGECVECLDEKARQCSFSLTYGDAFLCICPVRVHIAKADNQLALL